MLTIKKDKYGIYRFNKIHSFKYKDFENNRVTFRTDKVYDLLDGFCWQVTPPNNEDEIVMDCNIDYKDRYLTMLKENDAGQDINKIENEIDDWLELISDNMIESTEAY